jgi:P2 family phage contractile tail tube protein
MLPHKLKNMRLFGDGENYLGKAKALALPKLAITGEGYRGAGMLSEVETDMGLEKLELEVTYGGFMREILRQFGVTKLDGTMLRFVGAYQADDNASVQAGELVVRGRHREIDPGNAEVGKDTEWKVKSALTYIKWTVDGAVEVEIDVLGMIYMIGGIDRYAEIRAALGG